MIRHGLSNYNRKQTCLELETRITSNEAWGQCSYSDWKNQRKILDITSNIGDVTKDHSSPTQNSTFEGAHRIQRLKVLTRNMMRAPKVSI